MLPSSMAYTRSIVFQRSCHSVGRATWVSMLGRHTPRKLKVLPRHRKACRKMRYLMSFAMLMIMRTMSPNRESALRMLNTSNQQVMQANCAQARPKSRWYMDSDSPGSIDTRPRAEALEAMHIAITATSSRFHPFPRYSAQPSLKNCPNSCSSIQIALVPHKTLATWLTRDHVTMSLTTDSSPLASWNLPSVCVMYRLTDISVVKTISSIGVIMDR
mmetsp:Transcript_22780/g.58381  ORF Transcript_22780/g.58381 Transcript_22780/m.58381 type:complete len:216 (+) Transcript_22780:752-1399(+)